MTALPVPSRPRVGVRASAGGAELWLMDEIGEYGVTARQFVVDLKVAWWPGDAPGVVAGRRRIPGLAMAEAVRQHGNVVAVVDDQSCPAGPGRSPTISRARRLSSRARTAPSTVEQTRTNATTNSQPM